MRLPVETAVDAALCPSSIVVPPRRFAASCCGYARLAQESPTRACFTSRPVLVCSAPVGAFPPGERQKGQTLAACATVADAKSCFAVGSTRWAGV